MLLEVMTTRKKCTYDLNGPCERNRAVEKENILDREIEFTKREQRERDGKKRRQEWWQRNGTGGGEDLDIAIVLVV